jgi:hypothetical protein
MQSPPKAVLMSEKYLTQVASYSFLERERDEG